MNCLIRSKAQEEERKRIARELHDDVSPFLLLLIQRLDTITSSNRPQQSQDLRPRILDDLGLVAALEWMVAPHYIESKSSS